MKLLPFTTDNLSVAMANKYTPADVVKQKRQFLYLEEYLSNPEMNAQTILIEEEYISKDFLHDYASYYSLCFETYPKFCSRIHFFSRSIEPEEMNNAIIGAHRSPTEFWESYLGFIVIKPIPNTIIGYTVLKTYSNAQAFDTRYFWGLRKYKIHFFGNEIELNSLAFQEQDSVLAACATTAIWSMLNKAAEDFGTILKSPSQITKDADNLSFDGNRLFPNKGLNIIQLSQAIHNSGLVSEIKQADYEITDAAGNVLAEVVSTERVRKILNAYSSIGIPIILVINVPDNGSYGLHAVTVSGYKQLAPFILPPSHQTSWLANNIEKIYAHDDQWGPFAKIEFDGDDKLITHWSTFHPYKNPTYVTHVVVPLYPKIRIAYEDIEAIVLTLDAIFTLFFDAKIHSDLVWDIKVDFSENYKQRIKSSNIDSGEKLARLTKSQPKYLWIASCYVGQYIIMEFTFDATDVSNGMIGIDLISYLPQEIREALKTHLELNRYWQEPLFNHMSKKQFYQFLIDKI